MRLVSLEKEILSNLFIKPNFDNSNVVVVFTRTKEITGINWRLLDKENIISSGFESVDTEQVSFTVEMPGFTPWSPNNPYLYKFEFVFEYPEGSIAFLQNFGMRKLHATSHDIFLNNEPFFARGYVRGRSAHEHPDLCNLGDEEYYSKNIRNAKKYGFNLIRFHSTVPPKECFDAADKLGMFVHVEIRPYFGLYQKEQREKIEKNTDIISDEDWADLIKFNRNHPSLMVYCIGNEIRNPGIKPRVAEIAALTKKYDDTRFFLDTCAHGEFDRDNVDIDVQHMSYFYPFGKNYDMFENTYNWYIYGSAKDAVLSKRIEGQGCLASVIRSIEARRPIIAHEICHYIALHDLERLEKRFVKYDSPKPWWIEELKKLIKLKKLEDDYPKMLKASERFQFMSWKLGLEAIRRSPLLRGFHFLQLSDTNLYENGNGILDCFDDCKSVNADDFNLFNDDCVILADLPQRTYFEGDKVMIPVIVSHFSDKISGDADLEFVLRNKADGSSLINGTFEGINLDARGRREICKVELEMPKTIDAKALELELILKNTNSTCLMKNSWDLWLYPNNPQRLDSMNCTIALDGVRTELRYPQIKSKGTIDTPEKLLIVNRLSEQVFNHLGSGGDVWCMYRVPITRDRLKRSKREEYYLPTTWDRFKAVIWDRGTNCGGFIRENSAFDCFPNDGFMDLQFSGLVDDCDKIVLDDFPCDIEPIMQGVDKAVRDRYDVKKYNLPEFMPDRTMRKFAYAFEMKVGEGRLFVTGFNFTGINAEQPEVCAMFESIISYISSENFVPKASITVEELKSYLDEKGKEPIVKERKMTQFWQLNSEPLESAQYWKASEDYLEEKYKF